mgnify:CR=1 FL=1
MEQYTGTKPVAPSHAFDVAALEAHLAAHLPGQRRGGGRGSEASLPDSQQRAPSRHGLRRRPARRAARLPARPATDSLLACPNLELGPGARLNLLQLAAHLDGARTRRDPDRILDAARVHLLPPAQVTLRRPVGGPDACVGLHVDPDGTFCAVGSLDNLMKGAASQAVQNLNLMLGLGAQVGLEDLSL